MQFTRKDELAAQLNSETLAWTSLLLSAVIILVAYPVVWLSSRSRMPGLRLAANARNVLRVMHGQQVPRERKAHGSQNSTRSLMKDLSLLPAFDRRDARERPLCSNLARSRVGTPCVQNLNGCLRHSMRQSSSCH